MNKALSIAKFGKYSAQRAFNYYQSVLQRFDNTAQRSEVQIIAVIHAHYNMPIFLQALQMIGQLRGIVIKDSTASMHSKTREFLSAHGFPVLDWQKDEFIKDQSVIIDKLDNLLDPCKPFIIADHGGYFAYDDKLFQHFGADRLLGVVEYTANGEERYKQLQINDRPILSVGRSSLKAPADNASAQLLVLAAFRYLSSIGLSLFDDHNTIGVIGYGRLGSTVAKTIAHNQFEYLLVNDIDQTVIDKEHKKHFTDKKTLLSESNILFCATGHQAISPQQFNQLRDGCFIFNVTSPDDELKLDEVIKQGIIKLTDIEDATHEYTVTQTGHKIYLPYNGKSPTTTFEFGVTNPKIHLPIVSHLIAAKIIMQAHQTLQKGMNALSDSVTTIIEGEYSRHFARKAPGALPNPAF